MKYGIYQWGELKYTGKIKDCQRIAKRWKQQHGNADLQVMKITKKTNETK